ncbi:UV DNA damage repair endonuclease UvsE [Bacillus taeanensis]|uniref:UV DNA damage repair endonuclease UvsE n=1 Tax=Bacillus taeanensis TaxID=273032 RepID=A0A366XNA6_9BACI|nr:UV DNA damage repair endonuclease UvsE [Bacillus taeanensis]RBW67830.1 UV DNA damage repair endonuclease UvsE [Bacillus taeanensis]
MTIVRLGYVAMSVQLKNSSPSQTMTYKQFSQLQNREAAIRKLERIAESNLTNCLRLLKHNAAHDIHFFRFSSKLIPLANHEELSDWNYMRPLKDILQEVGEYVDEHNMRVDFHPDHFVLLNSPKTDVLKNSLVTLNMHRALLKGMNIDPKHRCVMHVGGNYQNKESALERFIHNWGLVPQGIQEMIMLENDDTSFTLKDTLYLCQKLAIPLVFDHHHHLANHEEKEWEECWSGVLDTWSHSPLPVKMHISSPKNEKQFRHHSEYIDVMQFLSFLDTVKGSTDRIDCMIEAKKKDGALFQLVRELKQVSYIEWIDESSFHIK